MNILGPGEGEPSFRGSSRDRVDVDEWQAVERVRNSLFTHS